MLLLTLHKVAGSHHSLALLGEQLAEAYATLKSSSKPVAGSALQFLDVLHWQRQSQQVQKYKDQRLFWLRQLAYAPPKLYLPYDEAEEGIDRQPGSAACITFMVGLPTQVCMHACMHEYLLLGEYIDISASEMGVYKAVSIADSW